MSISLRSLFLNNLSQTSLEPMSLEIVKAEGCWMEDKNGKKYLDFISGISVSNLGHRHPDVINAIKRQLDDYMHLMVYGEFIQGPQVTLAKALADLLPKTLDNVYFVNSGAEAVEGAMKLAKRFTGRSEIISFNNSYHGSTQGALSVMGNEMFKNQFRPLLPGIKHFNYNDEKCLKEITEKTACVIVEPVQAEAGVVESKNNFLKKLSARCKEKNALLILDEIQTGFGRTGTFFAFEQLDFVPDVLLLAKAMGGGMPIGAFISSKEIMSVLSHNPVLGHITTFGGHPVSCAAALANIEAIKELELHKRAFPIRDFILQKIKHKRIKEIRCCGALMAIDLGTIEFNMKVIQLCVSKGLIVDWFLFAAHCIRLSPPLIISEEELEFACKIILEAIDEA